jgi:hypothetical protein
MARPIGSTPKLNKKATDAFLHRVKKDLKKRARPIPTPKIDEAIVMIMSDANNRQK